MESSEGNSACPYPSHPPPLALPMWQMPEHQCAYLPGRLARNRAVHFGPGQSLDGATYHAFMDAGFRRSGRWVYQPICTGCRACLPIRVPVGDFAPSTSQRRCWRKNADLSVSVGPPRPCDERWDLYRRYVRQRHGGAMEEDRESFDAFLYDSPVPSVEFVYRERGGRLVAVGICDLCPDALSSVYFYFDPQERRRGLGTFGAMREIAFALESGLSYYYLGFWVQGCRSMEYKNQFHPHEILHPDGRWRGEVQSP